ncbi:MAG: GNAT family N-acetyltransferase [Sphingomonadales bacterium]|nr:GNAT family N-acetyltransferase [Sphingomonadales bacterium]
MADTVATTDRLFLREWDDADEVRFYDIMNRPAVMRHLGGLQSPEQWREAFHRLRGFQEEFGHTFWIIEDRASGDILGFCGLKRVNAPGAGDLTDQHEIGWRLRESAWGQGIAKEAAIASIDLAFSRFAAPHVIAPTARGNRASQGLMKRLGMIRRPDLDYIDARFPAVSEITPQIVHSIDAADWPSARAGALGPR